MEYNLLKLPVGIQTFEMIRTEGFLYVDKASLCFKKKWTFANMNFTKTVKI